jgi:hypothetical protein
VPPVADQATLLVVDVEDPFADDQAIAKRHNASVAFEAGVGHKSRDKPCVQGSNVAQSGPGVFDRSLGLDFFTNGCHTESILGIS